MYLSNEHSQLHDMSGCNTVVDQAALSRFLTGVLLRLAVIAFSIAFTSAGHGVNSMGDAKAPETIHQASETGAEK